MLFFLPPAAARMDAEVCWADGEWGHSSTGHSETTSKNEGTESGHSTSIFTSQSHAKCVADWS